MCLNNKGITIIESLVAILLLGIAIVGLMTMQPLSWKSAGKADSMSRATQLLQAELETMENSIMSGTVPSNKVNTSVTTGGETFTLNTTITTPTATTWLVHARVTWSGNSNGVKSSLLISRQMGF